MGGKLIVLIGSSRDDLDLLERAIRNVYPDSVCISFIFADEAIDAITQFLTRSPDFIFIDANSARISGPECLTRLRRLDALTNCHIVMFSGVMPAAVGEAYLNLGASRYFQKPVGAPQYHTTIGDVLRSLPAA